MRTPIGNLMAAHQAVITGTQDIGLKGMEAATRFFELQTQVAQGMLASGSEAAHGGVPDPMGMTRGLAEYLQRAAQLTWETQAEMSQLLGRQAGQLQKLYGELLTQAVQSLSSLHDLQPHTSGRHGSRAAAAAA